MTTNSAYTQKGKKANFVMVPKSLLGNPLLDPNDIVVWITIKSFDFNKKLPFVGVPCIHTKTGIRIKTIYQCIKNLEKNHYLVVQKRPGMTSIYKPQALGF
jgi:hypothetical protein